MCCSERGQILKLHFTGGHCADISSALDLIQGRKAEQLLADRAYDADFLLCYLDSEGIEAVIPPKSNRKDRRPYNQIAYKDRNVIERVFAKLKEYRRIATQYEKTVKSFSSFCYAAAIFHNLNVNTA